MVSIHTNLSSLIAQGSLTKSTNTLNRAIEQMSTGYKINHASDNAANYSIKTNMDTKIGAYMVAEDNAMMGLDMLQTAESSLNQISDKLSRLRALAVTAQNGTYGGQSLNALQVEADSITNEIQRLYSTATYSGIKLLDSRSEIPDGIGLTKEITPKYDAFIENPKDYTALEVRNMTELKNVDVYTLISSGQYSISTTNELVKLAEMVNNGRITGGEFVLSNDIDLSEYATGEGWTPIKSWSSNCIFNGNGNIITGLYINRPGEEEVGLFKLNAGKIKNLAIEDCDIIGGDMTGAVTGSSRYSTSLIENCFSTGKIIAAKRSGGIVGYMYNSKIENSYSLVEVLSTAEGGNVGGLVGSLQSSSIVSCFSESIVKGETNVGGLVGSVWHGSIKNSYSSNEVDGNNYIGGIVGYAQLESIENCTSDSIVKGSASVGGIAGVLSPVDSNFVVKNCSFIGSVEGLTRIGGLCGYLETKGYICDAENIYIKASINCLDGVAGGVVGQITNSDGVLNVKNIKSYSKVIDVNNKKNNIANFIGYVSLSSDGITFGTMNIETCSVSSSQENIISPLSGNSIGYDINNLLVGIKDVELPRQDIVLQVGISSKKEASISFNSKVEYDIIKSFKRFDIKDSRSIEKLDKILSNLNEKQIDLGSIQNRLESVLEEINVQYENLVSSRSTIQDADMSEVSATYIQQQILQQASATLMATANQTPTIALQLI